MASDMTSASTRLLHIFATFDAGGPQVRTLAVCRRLGGAFAHRFVAADGRIGAASRVGGLDADVVAMPPLRGNWAQLQALLQQVREFAPDLVLTYNWGAILGVLAARLARRPCVHHEEVVPDDERRMRMRRRNLMRRWVLAGAHAVVVPSRGLLQKATSVWRLPAARVRYVPNGVDLVSHQPRVARSDGPLVVGCVAHARPEKNLPRLLRAFAEARCRDRVELHMIGGGQGLPSCQQLATTLGIADRVRWWGSCDDTAARYREMDVVVLPSDDEQMPLAVLEAMAHGLPVIATRVGDVEMMLPATQQPFLVRVGPDAHALLARHLDALLADEALRAQLGGQNRAFAAEHFDLDRVATDYRELILQAQRRHAARVSA